MVDHDRNVGTVLDKLDELGIADNTIVLYSTDNGPHMNAWPDAGMTPFRNEKNSNWEGAYPRTRHGALAGQDQARHDRQTTSCRTWTGCPHCWQLPGIPDIKEKLKDGLRVGDKSFKVHLDGYNFLPYLTGREEQGPREEFFYFSDDGDLTALRFDNWKVVFAQQRATGTMSVWSEPYVQTRIPWLYNLRTDPYERASVTSNTYWDWWLDHAFLLVPGSGICRQLPGDVRGIPAAPESSQLHHRSGHGEDDAADTVIAGNQVSPEWLPCPAARELSL